jgi:hypothetical protein
VQITSPGSNVNWFFAKHYIGVMCGRLSDIQASGTLTIPEKDVQKNSRTGGQKKKAGSTRSRASRLK